MSFLQKLFGSPSVKKLKARGDINGLIKALQYPDSSERQDAIRALTDIADSKAVEPLFLTLQSSDSTERVLAIKALKSIGDIRALEPLLLALNDEAPSVRRQAILALGKIGSVQQIEKPLLNLMNEDPSLWVRKSAAQTLGERGNERAINFFISRLRDISLDDTERSKAGNELIAIGTPAIGALINKIDNSNSGWAVIQVLGKISGQEFGTDIRRWQEWWGKQPKIDYFNYSYDPD